MKMNTICMKCEKDERTKRHLMINPASDSMGKMKIIATMYEDGYTVEEIAAIVKVKPSAIYAVLRSDA